MNYIDEIDKIKEVISDAEIVSFDIFDTLLLRNVIEPIDIFKVVEIEYCKKFNEKIDFFDKRVKAERMARESTKLEDITFDDIYKNIDAFFGINKSKELRKLEIDSEKKFIIPNKYIKEVFELAKQKEKQILLISDMYLPKDIIIELLNCNEYFGYSNIYISSEIKKTKAMGSIYAYIKENLNINSQKWVHIGDNYVSDYKNSLEMGINGVYYQALKDREILYKIHNLSESIIRAIQINTKYCKEDMSYWSEFGMMYVFPMYLGLMLDIINKLKGKENIYFLSRDGYMPYKIYNKLREYYNDIPKAKYIYASRRAYIYPTLLKDKRKAVEFFTIYNKSFGQNLTLREILNNLEIEISLGEKVLQKHKLLDMDEVINEINLIQVQNILLELWDEIEIKLKEEKDLLQQYFIQEGLNEFTSINIFDIGWAGSTHKAMKELLKKDIYGYYFGTNDFIDKYIKNNSYGYAFNNGIPRKRYKAIIDNVMMYEFLFTAPEGSLKKFKRIGAKVKPVLKETQDSISRDKVLIFQNSILELLDIILKYKDYLTDITKDFSLSMIEQLIEMKNVKDLCEFLKINNIVTIGESKDFKNYVTKIDYIDYKRDTKYYKTLCQTNLWRDAILIEDNQERLFNVREFEKLYSIKDYFYISDKFKRPYILIKKAIKNPRKAIHKILKKI